MTSVFLGSTAPSVLASAIGSFALDPAPRGDGRTLHNWRVLARAGAEDLVAARLAEAHLDAATILAELDGPTVEPGSLWGVWAAESPDEVLHAGQEPDGWRLDGAKPWCSGARRCTRALVTARGRGGRRLLAVDVADTAPREPDWAAAGMAGDAPATVDFSRVPAHPVGEPRAYLERPGFWHGATGVAAAWFGGAVGVAGALHRAGRAGRLDAHGHAHLGAVDAALAAARGMLREAAAAVDPPAAGREPLAVARRRALRVRACVEVAVEETVRRTGRALGPGPFARDAAHARRVADLEVYVRQSHAERDLADLGELAADEHGLELDGDVL